MYKTLLEKPPLHLPKSNLTNGIVLKGEDLLVLHQLYIHSSMRAPSIHEIYQSTYPKDVERNSKWISNRLKKLSEAGLIEQLQERLSERGRLQSLVSYHYRLDRRGYEVLIAEGLVEEDEAKKLMMYSKRKRFPTIHTRATSYLANAIFLKLLDCSQTQGFTHIRGSRHIYLGVSDESVVKEFKGLIVPDWVFERENVIVAIEVDTGSQRGEIIGKKYKRYVKVAKYYQTLGKQLVVVFAPTDSSVMEFAVGREIHKENRDKRINSLKDAFPLHVEWPDNLHFYVATAKRVPNVIVKILSGQEPAEEIDKILNTNTWFDLLKTHLPNDRIVQMEKLDNVLLPNRNRQLDPEFVFQLSKNGATKERHLAMFSEEGSVRSYQQIRNNAMLVYKYNANPKETIPLYLNAIYLDQESADEEVYGNDVYESIYFRDLATLEQLNDTGGQVVHAKKLTSPFKKEEVEMFV